MTKCLDKLDGYAIIQTMKTCRKCGESFDGRRCKNCQRIYKAAHHKANADRINAHVAEYRRANRDKVKETKARYVRENREKVNAYWRKKRADNPEKIRAEKAEYRTKNREAVNSYHVQWCAENHEKRKEHQVKYALANPGLSRIKNHARRARVIGTGQKLSKDIVQKLRKRQHEKCICCGLPLGKDYHIDHIMPLALGGGNNDGNVQLLRAVCNDKKGAKHPIDFMQSRGFLL